MKVAIIGAGVIGVTTAYELARDGHEVTVFERRGTVAEETSFANAGVLAPGYVTPWYAPGMPLKVLSQVASRHAAVRIRPGLRMDDIAWLWKFWRSCNLQTYTAHRRALQQLAFYSRKRLHAITAEQEIEYDRALGYTVLLRSAKDRAAVQAGLDVLRELGVSYTELNEAGTRQLEPALNPDTRFAGSIHLPDDEIGNCRQFTLIMKDGCRELGVDFEFNTAVAHMECAQTATLFVAREASGDAPQPRTFDAVVVCAGVASGTLLKPLGLELPLRPVYGYSVSCHVKEPLNAPRSGLMDEHYKVAISRLGQRVRVAGSAEIGGSAHWKNPAALRTLYKVLQDWFPGAGVMSHGVQEWKGARPMLANRPPVIGPSGVPSLWLNLGQGSSGWTLACGSARLLADQMASRSPDINPAAYRL